MLNCSWHERIPIVGRSVVNGEVKRLVYLDDVREIIMSSMVAYGYRMNPRGRIEHRLFDHTDLHHGEAMRNGWKDCPEKVPGHAVAEARKVAERAATAHKTGREPKVTGEVHGMNMKTTPNKAAKGPKDGDIKYIDTPKGKRAMRNGRFVKS